jgi:hypothetical protein
VRAPHEFGSCFAPLQAYRALMGRRGRARRYRSMMIYGEAQFAAFECPSRKLRHASPIIKTAIWVEADKHRYQFGGVAEVSHSEGNVGFSQRCNYLHDNSDPGCPDGTPVLPIWQGQRLSQQCLSVVREAIRKAGCAILLEP